MKFATIFHRNCKQNLSKEKSIFLLTHAQYIQRNIKDPYLSLCDSFEC